MSWPSRVRSTSNSIISTPASAAAVKLSIVLPGAIRSAPLWPMRRNPIECFPRATLVSAIAAPVDKELEDRAEPGEDAGRCDTADQRRERECGAVLLLG